LSSLARVLAYIKFEHYNILHLPLVGLFKCSTKTFEKLPIGKRLQYYNSIHWSNIFRGGVSAPSSSFVENLQRRWMWCSHDHDSL